MNDPRIIELAIHKNIIHNFHQKPLSKKQTITNSIRPDYEIMTLEDVEYVDIIPIIQRYLPFIKVLMPIELDSAIRKHLKDYDTTDLSKYLKQTDLP